MGCFGHACVLRLVHTVIGGLIINPTEEIGILVMVTNKRGQVCSVAPCIRPVELTSAEWPPPPGISPAEKPQGFPWLVCDRSVFLDPPSHRTSELSLMGWSEYPRQTALLSV